MAESMYQPRLIAKSGQVALIISDFQATVLYECMLTQMDGSSWAKLRKKVCDKYNFSVDDIKGQTGRLSMILRDHVHENRKKS